MIVRREIKFKDYCEAPNKRLKKVMKFDDCIYSKTLDFIISDYNGLTLKEMYTPRVENNAVVTFWDDVINTFDGIGVLHRASAVRAAYPLVRKLMELYIQLKFLLCDDTENKALAYEAYYESRSLKGEDYYKSIAHKWPKYELYKKEADIAFAKKQKPKFEEWYAMYDRVKRKSNEEVADNNNKKVENIFILRNFRDLCKAVNEEGLYNKYYSLLSKEAHGRLGRDLLKYDNEREASYAENFRNPEGLYFQTWFCSILMRKTYCLVCCHYSFPINEVFLKAQIEKLKKLQELKNKYLNGEL